MVVHQQNNDSDASVEDYEFNGFIRIVKMTILPHSVGGTQLGVVRGTLVQPEPLNDWRRIAIFQTCTKIDNKNCKIIVDSGSCITLLR